MVVDIGEKTAPRDANKTMAFFWVTVKVEYATSVATIRSLAGSALGSGCSDASPGTGVGLWSGSICGIELIEEQWRALFRGIYSMGTEVGSRKIYKNVHCPRSCIHDGMGE